MCQFLWENECNKQYITRICSYGKFLSWFSVQGHVMDVCHFPRPRVCMHLHCEWVVTLSWKLTWSASLLSLSLFPSLYRSLFHSLYFSLSLLHSTVDHSLLYVLSAFSFYLLSGSENDLHPSILLQSRPFLTVDFTKHQSVGTDR
jgi:hypothetical protein